MKSFLSYLGGKSLLVDTILPLIPPHTCYCEVFSGAAWLFFAKRESDVEIINDINKDLITLYRVIQNHLEEFIRHFKWVLTARDEFDRLKSMNPDTLTDIQRAVRFYYLLRCAFGAKVVGQTFNINPSHPPRLNLLRIEEDLSAAHLRLCRAYIENRPYQDIITRTDRPDTFFYLDPPYYGCENDYGRGIFSREDFSRLAEILSTIHGKFILSINDTPEIREVFNPFLINEVSTKYSLSTRNAEHTEGVTELLVMNFQPQARTPGLFDEIY